MPASNYAGIPTGGAVWASADLLAQLAQGGVQLWGVLAREVADRALNDASTACDDLVCNAPGCADANAWWPLGQASAGAAATTVIGIEGPESLEQIQLGIAPSPPAHDLAFQTVLLSPKLASLVADGGAVFVTYTLEDAGAEAGATVDLSGLVPPPPIVVPGPTTVNDSNAQGFSVDIEAADGGLTQHLWMSLAQSQDLVDPSLDPTVYYDASLLVPAMVGLGAVPGFLQRFLQPEARTG
jgi:hypothetical protein